MRRNNIIEEQELGKSVQIQRTLKGRTIKDLANKLNVSVQQMQKYEAGKNRITVSTLKDIAAELGIPITIFFEGHNSQYNFNDDFFNSQSQATQLIQKFLEIKETKIKNLLLDLTTVLSQVKMT